MTDRNAWNIEKLLEWKAEVEIRFRDLNGWQHDHDEFKNTTIQQLIVIFDTLKELKEGDKWLKRMFITALVGTGVTSIGALIVWAFQN